MYEISYEELGNAGENQGMQEIKSILRYVSVFIVTAIFLTGILVLSACIPQSAIRENVQKSAEYLCEGELFGMVVDGANGSKIDRYADSILLAIAYQYDSEHPLRSVMLSSYYYLPYQNENENLLLAVTEGYGPNQQYLRYWHGSNTFVRPLLVCFSLKQIYMIHGVMLAVLVLLLLLILIKNKAYIPALGVFLGLVVTAAWFVPLSLEYTWTYMLMLLLSIIGVEASLRQRKYIPFLFLIGGMVTSYMDFLTTETLTLTVPLLLILWIQYNRSTETSRVSLWKKIVRDVILWGIGYVGMWISKWILASVVLQENVMPYVSGHMEERLGGDIGIGRWQYLWGAVSRNLACLFPFGYGAPGVLAGIALVLFAFYVGYVYRGKQFSVQKVVCYAFLGLIPYVRYLVLHNHSYLHSFFTYRAQMATVLAVVLILEEVVDRRWFADAEN